MNVKTNIKQCLVILFFIFSLIYSLYPSSPSTEIQVVQLKQSPFKQLWMKTVSLEHKNRAPSSLSIISGVNPPVKICWAIEKKINIFDLNGNQLTKEIKSPFTIETTFLTKDTRTLVIIGKENIARLNLETNEISTPIPLPIKKYGPFQVTLKVKGDHHYWIGGIITRDKHYIACLFTFTGDGKLKSCVGVSVFPVAGVTDSIVKGNDRIEVLWVWDFSGVICITAGGKGIYQYNSGLKWRFFLEPTRYHFQGICKIGSGEIAAVFMGPGSENHLKSRLVRFIRRGDQVKAHGESLDYLYTCSASEDRRACFAGFRIKSTPPRIDVEAAASLVFDSQGKPVEHLWESSALPVEGYYLENRPCFLLTGGYVMVLDHAHMPLWQEESNLMGDWEFIPLDLDGDNKRDDFLVAGQNKGSGELHNLLAMVNQEEIVVEKALRAFQIAMELQEKEKESWIPGIFREKKKQRVLNAFREASSLFEQVDMQEHLQKTREIIENLEKSLKKIKKLKGIIFLILGGAAIFLVIILLVRYRGRIRDLFLKGIEYGTRQIMRIRMFNIPEVEDLYRSQDHLREHLKQIKEKASQLEGDERETILAEIPLLEREVNTMRDRSFYPGVSAKISKLETQMLQAGEEEEAAVYQVPFQLANPAVYPVGRPISDLHLYCGRSRQLEQLFRALTHSESMIVEGQFRIGKSSILRLTEKRLPGKFPCVYYDAGLLKPGGRGLNVWLKILGESCDKALDSRTFSQWKSQKSTAEMNAADIGQRFLQEWLIPLKQQKGNIIIMFDEFQHIIDTIDQSTSGLLKHIVENSLLTFVFCVRSRALLPAEHRVFNSIRPLHLGQLEDEGIAELLELPERLFGHRYSTAAKRRLKQLTGGHPYYIQVAHAVLAERLNAEKTNFLRETPHIDETVIYKILERLESHFRTEWMHLSEIERRIILQLVQGRYTLSEAELFDRVCRGKNHLPKEFTAALYHLKEIVQIISFTGQQYTVKLGLWTHWGRNQNPGDLLQKKEIKNG